MLEDARRTLIRDAAKRCSQTLEAYPLGEVDDVAAPHFLSLCQSIRALLALASDYLDDITDRLDDLMALQGVSLTGKGVLARQVRGANLGRCRACGVGSLLSLLHDIVVQGLHFRLGPRHEHP